MRLPESLEELFPFFSVLVYFAIVFGLSELSRKVVDRLFSRNTTPYVFFIELIATVKMCTCVYENAVMIRRYGVIAFFFTVVSLLTMGGRLNRGASVSPLGPIEALYNGIIGWPRLLTLLLAQTIGGLSAFRVATSVWYYTLDYSADHFENYHNIDCALNYKLPFYQVMLWEIAACGLVRLAVHLIPDRTRPFFTPIFIAGMLSTALVVVGVPGLNPTVASSRLFGCRGLDAQWFIALYWICPVIGWMSAVKLIEKFKKSAPKKLKKKTK